MTSVQPLGGGVSGGSDDEPNNLPITWSRPSSEPTSVCGSRESVHRRSSAGARQQLPGRKAGHASAAARPIGPPATGDRRPPCRGREPYWPAARFARIVRPICLLAGRPAGSSCCRWTRKINNNSRRPANSRSRTKCKNAVAGLHLLPARLGQSRSAPTKLGSSALRFSNYASRPTDKQINKFQRSQFGRPLCAT